MSLPDFSKCSPEDIAKFKDQFRDVPLIAIGHDDMIKRIDPVGCGCTDCLTGESKPLDQCDRMDLHLLVTGRVQNASSVKPIVTIQIGDRTEFIMDFQIPTPPHDRGGGILH